ncbi:MAG TPA: NADH-quinone oxidoreductase subunit J [Nitrospirota bacterium]|nr:NADH-quinone oxidoreductase subunit J [Nitrospirota bacterium]
MVIQVGFAYFASVILFCALMVITRRNPVHCALFMLPLMFHVAGIFIMLNAEFVAAVQVLVYAGAIMVLFLFVIMLFKGADGQKDKAGFQGSWPVIVPLITVLCGFFMSILVRASFNGTKGQYPIEAVAKIGNSQAVGRVLFTDFLFPFEVASVILLVAMVGAIVLAKKGAE